MDLPGLEVDGLEEGAAERHDHGPFDLIAEVVGIDDGAAFERGDQAFDDEGPFGASMRALSHECVRVEEPEKLAQYVLRGESAWTPSAIEKAMAIDDQAVVIDFIVGQDAQVWPMVPAGTSNYEIMAARGVRPVWDEVEG